MSTIVFRLPMSCAPLLLIAAAPPDRARVGHVIDGDTFRLESGERIRIAGIDASETQAGQARCRAEIVLGRTPTVRARALLDGRTVTIMRVGRRALVAALAAQARLVCARTPLRQEMAASRPAPAGRGAADIQGVSRSGGTAKSPAAKRARIAA